VIETAGQTGGLDLGDALRGQKRLTVTFEEIGYQLPAGNGVLDLQVNGQWTLIPFSQFKQPDGSAPLPIDVLWTDKSWPVNVGAFEAAATRPPTAVPVKTEAWVEKLLSGSSVLWQFGMDDASADEFVGTSLDVASGDAAATLPRGLELQTRPSLIVRFDLKEIPAHGAAFVLKVHDADVLVPQAAVFVNGVMSGLFQLIGYDQSPGGRTTDRDWIVTIPPERLKVGANLLTLRLLPSMYDDTGKAVENQSEEYIRQMALGDRKDNPFLSSSWLEWDTFRLVELGAPLIEFVNGRPLWMGLNTGTYVKRSPAEWKDWILRDIAYLGLTGSEGPMRIGVWTASDLRGMTRTDPSLPEGQAVGDWQLQSLCDLGLRPYFVFEPGRALRSVGEVAESSEANAIKRFGKFVDAIEIGNEVDHAHYGFDSFSLAAAYATIQKESTVGQMLKSYDDDGDLKVVGQGWYQAWVFSVIDAQARQETSEDPGFTDALAAHA